MLKNCFKPLLRVNFFKRRCVLLVWHVVISLTVFNVSAAHWPQFRGPEGRAIAEDGKPPLYFSPTSNVVWKISLPPGHSSPCIHGDRIFVTSLNQKQVETLCIDRKGGQILWRQNAPAESIESTHRIGSPAASTATTDGSFVYVYFGSYGLLAYDFTGKEQWRLPLPAPMVEFGTGTSPILAGDWLIVVCDQDQGSYLLAVDKRTGKQVWRTERPEFRRGFSSPFIWNHDSTRELVVPGSIWLRAYDPDTGKEVWSFTGTSRVANSSPTSGDGLLFSSSWNVGGDDRDRIKLEPFHEFIRLNDRNGDRKLTRDEIPAGPVRDRFSQMDLNKDGLVVEAEWQTMVEMFEKAGNAVVAIRPGGKGDITASHLAWKSTRSLPYVCSPVYYQGRLYTVKNGGLASCYDAASGKALYQDERLNAGGDYYASLIASDGRIIASSQQGIVTIWKAGSTLKVLARNPLDEEVMATPAVIGDRLYVRTAGHLYSFGLKATQ